MARSITTSIEICAPAARVWDVLADVERYREWNPHIVEGSGTVAAGERLRLRMGGMTFRPRVLRAEPGRELRWLGSLGVRGLFDGEHRFTLEPLPAGGVRLAQAERFTGVLVPLLGRLLERTRGDFEAVNAALKARAEGEPPARATAV